MCSHQRKFGPWTVLTLSFLLLLVWFRIAGAQSPSQPLALRTAIAVIQTATAMAEPTATPNPAQQLATAIAVLATATAEAQTTPTPNPTEQLATALAIAATASAKAPTSTSPVESTATPILGQSPSFTPLPTWTFTPAPSTATPASPPRAATGVPGQRSIRETDGAEMVYVPDGEFRMGSTDADVDRAMSLCRAYTTYCDREWFQDQQPAHTVSLSAFWLDRTEVTNGQYRRCASAGVCAASGVEGSADLNGESHPVVGVSWSDARDYCRWAGARLPTEAEWEYAARNVEGRAFPWGAEFRGSAANYCDANCEYNWANKSVDDGFGTTAPVGAYPQGVGWCGALDLSGNVWEWVADWYAPYSGERQRDPTGPSFGRLRVVRGGSWADLAYSLMGADRHSVDPASKDRFFGFRCASSE